jgi:hypothetical protein
VIPFYLLASIRILRLYERGVAASDVADHGRDLGREESTIIFPAQFMTTVQEAIATLSRDTAQE